MYPALQVCGTAAGGGGAVGVHASGYAEIRF